LTETVQVGDRTGFVFLSYTYFFLQFYNLGM
jgi:hypothetical protein